MAESSAHKQERVSTMTAPPEIKQQNELAVKKKKVKTFWRTEAAWSRKPWLLNPCVHSAWCKSVSTCWWMNLEKTLPTGASVSFCYNMERGVALVLASILCARDYFWRTLQMREPRYSNFRKFAQTGDKYSKAKFPAWGFLSTKLVLCIPLGPSELSKYLNMLHFFPPINVRLWGKLGKYCYLHNRERNWGFAYKYLLSNGEPWDPGLLLCIMAFERSVNVLH